MPESDTGLLHIPTDSDNRSGGVWYVQAARCNEYPNLWGYARDLYKIPAFRNNTYFKDFANPNNKKVGALFFESFNARFLDEINFDAYWGAPHDRAHLSSDPGNKFKAEEQ